MSLKRIISFSLWGNKPLYTKGAFINIDEAAEIYPEWICRFYVSTDCPVLSELRQRNCEIFVREHSEIYVPAYSWRFLAASDPEAEYVIFRDCDSRVTTRELVCVNEWIASGKIAHVMRDYPAPHATETMLGGMWGIKGGIFPNIEQSMVNWMKEKNLRNRFNIDQEFITDCVWPKIQHDVIEHGYKYKSKEFVAFPKHPPMKYGEYVGQVIGVD